MSKTIIINTDDMKNILKEYFESADSIDNIFCEYCHERHHMCLAGDDECPYSNSDDMYDFFINYVFSSYMIPFS